MRNRLFTVSVIVCCLSFAISGCTYPADPEGTLQRVQGQSMVVGLVENQPWVTRLDSGEPAGVEVELVRRFAQELDATVEWVWGSEQKHMEALARFELDLAIMGLTRATPWNKRVGLTQPYYTTRIAVGVPSIMTAPVDLSGLTVAVKRGTVTAAYLTEEEAVALSGLALAGGGPTRLPPG